MQRLTRSLRTGVLGRLGRALTAAEARVLAAVALAAGGVWALLLLGGEVREGETSAFDRRIEVALRVPGQPHQPVGPPWLSESLRDVSALGGTTVIVLATLVACAALIFHKLWRRAAVLAGVVALASLSDQVLKRFYDRPRPDFAAAGLVTYAQSFPSGHSTSSAALWLSLAMIAASFERQRRAKSFWFAIAGLIILAVGFSRVYLGVHWPTDVLAGWMLGACWALAGWAAWHTLKPGWRGASP
jgi:undecaprenyl-diphosphatase